MCTLTLFFLRRAQIEKHRRNFRSNSSNYCQHTLRLYWTLERVRSEDKTQASKVEYFIHSVPIYYQYYFFICIKEISLTYCTLYKIAMIFVDLNIGLLNKVSTGQRSKCHIWNVENVIYSGLRRRMFAGRAKCVDFIKACQIWKSWEGTWLDPGDGQIANDVDSSAKL